MLKTRFESRYFCSLESFSIYTDVEHPQILFLGFFFGRKKKEKIQIFDKNHEVNPSVKVANIAFFKSPYFYSLESFCIDLED